MGAKFWVLCGLRPATPTNRSRCISDTAASVGKVANGIGFDAYVARVDRSMWSHWQLNQDASVEDSCIANTQHTQTSGGKAHCSSGGTVDQYHHDPRFARPPDSIVADDHSMFPLWQYRAQNGDVDRPDGMRRLPGLHGGCVSRKTTSRLSVRKRLPRAGT